VRELVEREMVDDDGEEIDDDGGSLARVCVVASYSIHSF
jgi:hypothetical protein